MAKVKQGKNRGVKRVKLLMILLGVLIIVLIAWNAFASAKLSADSGGILPATKCEPGSYGLSQKSFTLLVQDRQTKTPLAGKKVNVTAYAFNFNNSVWQKDNKTEVKITEVTSGADGKVEVRIPYCTLNISGKTKFFLGTENVIYRNIIFTSTWSMEAETDSRLYTGFTSDQYKNFIKTAGVAPVVLYDKSDQPAPAPTPTPSPTPTPTPTPAPAPGNLSSATVVKATLVGYMWNAEAKKWKTHQEKIDFPTNGLSFDSFKIFTGNLSSATKNSTAKTVQTKNFMEYKNKAGFVVTKIFIADYVNNKKKSTFAQTTFMPKKDAASATQYYTSQIKALNGMVFRALDKKAKQSQVKEKKPTKTKDLPIPALDKRYNASDFYQKSASGTLAAKKESVNPLNKFFGGLLDSFKMLAQKGNTSYDGKELPPYVKDL